MEPKYFIENRYSFVIDALPILNNTPYEVDTPETAFERDVQLQLAVANRLLMGEKYSAALEKYRHLRGLIGAVIHPQISVPNATGIDWSKINLAAIVDTVVAKSADLLFKTPIAESALPPKFRGSEVRLPEAVAREFSVFQQVGVQDRESGLGVLIHQAETLVADKQFDRALEVFKSAQSQTGDRALQGAIQHDMAILQERLGNRDQAIETMKAGAGLFEQAQDRDAQSQALAALAGIQARGGATDAANTTLKQVDELRKQHNLFPIVTLDFLQPSRPFVREAVTAAETRFDPGSVVFDRPVILPRPPVFGPILRGAPFPLGAPAQVTPEFTAQPVQLMATTAFADRKTEKQLTILDSASQPVRIQLDGGGAQGLNGFYETLSVTRDLGLLMGYLTSRTVTIAYLTQVYFWVLPMAIGDCLAALGSYAQAESEYLSTLNYKFLNQVVESVNLWLRLADLYIDWGDRLYRDARNDPSAFGPAREKYERVLRLDNTLDPNSPLYADPKFAGLRDRAAAAIQAVFVAGGSSEENPRLLSALMRARMQLTKIDAGLNFLGLSLHIPPFSFEYIQNLARYFTQHASQVEQMYIQFQSTGENEGLREQQMAQQSDIAAASVELEARGLDETQEGVDVAQANLNAANVQRQNAAQAANDFANVRWELQELERLQAWAGSASNDEVKLNVKHATYYSADSKPRSHVLFDLANRRARISHDLEANRLQREIAQADAYRGVAQQQVQQAQARVAVAQQRVAIAQMQAQFARENLEFLQGREFSSAMWYNLAREARRLARRYLDMAIEVATMMEKAYEAETGRDLRKIKFEYGLNELNGLLGAEALLLDIDFFSLDAVRTKSKKAQMRQTLSLADQFPMAFERLLQTGRTFFETTLDHFDRRYPGFYLQKVKQVEVVFVGLTGVEGVHGMLRNIGLSQFRTKSGEIVNQTYPADVMPLSEYDVRQDAVIFQLDTRELRLFENNGIATMWQLDLPLSTNTFDLRQILDIQLVIYYDGFFDPGLEQQILAALPASGSASRGISLRLYAPDELFFLRSQGQAELRLTTDFFPTNHTNQRLTSYSIQARGENVAGLQVRVQLSNLDAAHTFQLDAEGAADGAAFPAPIGQALFDTWTFVIDPGDNPGFDLAGLADLSLFLEYDFDFRS